MGRKTPISFNLGAMDILFSNFRLLRDREKGGGGSRRESNPMPLNSKISKSKIISSIEKMNIEPRLFLSF